MSARYSVFILTPQDSLATLVRSGLTDSVSIHQTTLQTIFNDLNTLPLPDVILIDTTQYDVEELTALCKQLQSIDAPPLFALTDASTDFPENFLNVGIYDYLSMPFNSKVLQHRLDLILKTKRDKEQILSQWVQIFEKNQAIKLIIRVRDAVIVDANTSASRFYGYLPSQLIGMKISELETRNSEQRLTSSDIPSSLMIFKHRTASGDERDVKIFSSSLLYGNEKCLLLIVFDLTRQRVAEAGEYHQRAIVTGLRQASNAILSTFDLQRILKIILNYAREVVSSEEAMILFLQNDQVTLASSIHSANLKDHVPPFKNTFPLNKLKHLQHVSQTGLPELIANTYENPDWLHIKGREWVRSSAIVPIHVEQHIIGFLTIDSSHTNHFQAIDLDRLMAFAEQAGIAIRNAQLYERIQKHSVELERRVAERTAQFTHEHEQLRATLNAMTEGVAYLELDSVKLPRALYINPALQALTGYTPLEWLEGEVQLLRANNTTFEEYRGIVEHAIQSLRTYSYWQMEVRIMRKDGSTFDSIITMTPVHTFLGEMSGAVMVMRDVSQEKALQVQKSQFVANASHELRTPIANLKTRLYLLRKQPQQADVHLAIINEVVERLQKLVEDLLDSSRFERGTIQVSPERLILQDVVQRTVLIQQPEAEAKNIQLLMALDDEPIPIYADPERLIQVITNLVINAINYTPEHGQVTVRAFSTDDLETGFQNAKVEIEDTGMGISPEQLQYVFQPFYRAASHIKGTGLGLSIAREIVELHGGGIEATSIKGQGSRFSFWLPLVREISPLAGANN